MPGSKNEKKISVKMFASSAVGDIATNGVEATQTSNDVILKEDSKKNMKKILTVLPTSDVKLKEFKDESYYPPEIHCEDPNSITSKSRKLNGFGSGTSTSTTSEF